jgi:hypothetical protein
MELESQNPNQDSQGDSKLCHLSRSERRSYDMWTAVYAIDSKPQPDVSLLYPTSTGRTCRDDGMTLFTALEFTALEFHFHSHLIHIVCLLFVEQVHLSMKQRLAKPSQETTRVLQEGIREIQTLLATLTVEFDQALVRYQQ